MPKIHVAMLLATITLLSPSVKALEQPDCAALESWAAGFAAPDTLMLAPKVELSAQLSDDKTVPLFGTPVEEWTGVDFNAVKNMLNKCRRPALKRGDKAAAQQLYEAMKAVAKGLKPLNTLRQYRERSTQSVDNIVNYHRVPELSQIIALAQRALTGEDVETEQKHCQELMNKPASELSVQDKMDLLQGCKE